MLAGCRDESRTRPCYREDAGEETLNDGLVGNLRKLVQELVADQNACDDTLLVAIPGLSCCVSRRQDDLQGISFELKHRVTRGQHAARANLRNRGNLGGIVPDGAAIRDSYSSLAVVVLCVSGGHGRSRQPWRLGETHLRQPERRGGQVWGTASVCMTLATRATRCL